MTKIWETNVILKLTLFQPSPRQTFQTMMIGTEFYWFLGFNNSLNFLHFVQLQHSSSWSTLLFRLVISFVVFTIFSSTLVFISEIKRISQSFSDVFGRPNALFIFLSRFDTLRQWFDVIRTANKTNKTKKGTLS